MKRRNAPTSSPATPCELSTVITCPESENRLYLPLQVTVRDEETVGTKALLDSGAEGLFVNHVFVAKHDLEVQAMRHPVLARNVDGTINKKGTIRSTVDLEYQLGSQKRTDTFMVTELGQHDIIFGQPWLDKHNPMIDWHDKIVYMPDEDDLSLDIHSINHVHKATELARSSQKKDDRPLREKVPEWLHDYIDVFDEEKAKRHPRSKGKHDHRIILKDGFVPRISKVYPLPPHEEQMMNDFIDENLEKGYIRPSNSPQASGFFFVGKKDGTGRPCQDYVYLNNWTVKDGYPTPRISELMDMCRDWKYFTKIDVKAGYNNIPIVEEDRWKAAFITKRGLFEPNVMFFGLCNSPATFQRFMDDCYGMVIRRKEGGVYMDDIITGHPNTPGCRERTRQCVKILLDNDLYAKEDKCQFCVEEVNYLGMKVRAGQLEMDPVKVAGIQDWPTPKTPRDVASFLGFCNFYRKFIPGYADMARPLDELKKKGVTFEWTDERDKAFKGLKELFLRKPMLQIPDPAKKFVLETDASKHASGAVLMQEDTNGDLRPCGYISKSFNQAEKNYQIYDRELLAIIQALKAWRHYLLGLEILIRCDHKNLTYFKQSQNLMPRQTQWHLYLSQFNYKIAHMLGSQMVQADALSQ